MKITINRAKELLDFMASLRAKSDWKREGNVLFRFDFLSQDRDRLEQLSNKLTSPFKKIEFLNAARPQLYMLVLHEKAGHSAESLIQRVGELDELARSLGIDGVDDISA